MSRTALIVNHKLSVLGRLTDGLVARGYAVVTASGHDEAIRLVFDHLPSLVIADLSVPGLTGAEFCSTVRDFSELDRVYLLGVSPAGFECDVFETLDAGADDVLRAPADESEILARLQVAERIIDLREMLECKTREIVRYSAELEVANRQLRSSNYRLRRMTTTDDLTGLANRRAAMESIGRRWSLAVRADQALTALVLDLDHFKQVNDTLGHDAGDMVLRHAAGVFMSETRAEEPVFRMGGEEFLILCERSGAVSAARAAERLRRALAAAPVFYRGETRHVTVSIGVAQRTPSMTGPDELIKAADDALYAAKGAGRNRVHIVDSRSGLPVPYGEPAAPARPGGASMRPDPRSPARERHMSG